MRSEGYSTWFVCVSVDAYSGTAGYEVAHEQYQQLHSYANLKIKM